MPAKKPAAKAAKAKKKPVARKPSAPKVAPKRKAAARVTEKPAKKKAAPAPKKAPAKPAARVVAKPTAKVVAKAPAKAARPELKAQPAAKTPAAKTPAPAPRAAAPVRQIPTAVMMPRRGKAAPLVFEDDEGGEATRHNLLLGPRNVQPYVPKKGEQYMNPEQLRHFQTILFTWKRDLMEEVDRTMTHMKDEAANPPDPNDRATLESEFALELRTRDRERKLIRKIDEAIKRIEDGSYGYCMETGEPIGIKRLEARPVATLCLEAQERRERREKQYGDRDDWYR